MLKFILKRLAILIPIIIGVSFLCYGILSFSPGDPARIKLGDRAPQEAVDQLREEMGLNDPFLVQYGRYVYNALQGDFGRSYLTNESVIKAIMDRFPVTLQLAIMSTLLMIVIGIPVGVISATMKYSLFDRTSMIMVLLATSVPGFWVGLLLIILFSVTLDLLPAGGYSGWITLIMPAICTGLSSTAVLARLTRTSLLEEMSKDYVRTAESKGLERNKAIWKHALKNSLVPVVTVLGTTFATSLGGSCVAESLFSLPGIGQLLLNSVRQKDTPVVMAATIMMAILMCVANMLVDILYAYLDPRMRSKIG